MKARYSEDERIECGCDEAGRGCLAGPVVAAAVVFPKDYVNPEINDSKQLTAKKREELRQIIEENALAYAVVFESEEVIDKINILRASIKAMNQAVMQLSVKPEFLLIDGNKFYNETGIPYLCVVKGDATYQSIAAASILAKTYRDEYMLKIAEEFPEYDWQHNMGYPTPAHQKAVIDHGLCKYHRKSFQLKCMQLELF
ncbi:MAG: ribonuclease HII [Bacteroidales bacterium]|nr:ribonuclease HII [Bacteroidales bacterium]